MSENKMGRPPLWKDAETLAAAIEEYFEWCDNRIQQVYDKKSGSVIEIINPMPYTMSGLAYYLHMDRRTLLDYSSKTGDPDFSPTIKAARNRVALDVENRLMEGGNATGAIFNLKNNFGWKDVSQQDGTQKLIVETRKHSAASATDEDTDVGDDEDD
jgi:hypothetical protein